MIDALPRTMAVVEVANPGGPEVLSLAKRPVPQPRTDELLIKVAASGLNRADAMQRQGNYPPPPGASDLLGLEVSGHVAGIGKGVEGFEIGDPVCALIAGGGYAQFCTAPASSCLPVPDSTSIVKAGAVPETFFTVWANVFMLGELAEGESCLIHGGASGIGTTAIQLAGAFGSNVYATAGSDDKCARCVELGAKSAINYKSADFVEAISDLTDGRGVDVVLDIIAGDYVNRNLKCLAKFGRLVIIATQGGIKAQINALSIMLKRLTLTGSTLRPRPNEEKAEIASQLQAQVWPLLQSGTIAPIIDSVYPFDEVLKAHQHLDSGDYVGKIVLRHD